MGILAGLLGCAFGILGIFTIGFVFVPLAAICTFVGLLRSISGRNIAGLGTSLVAGILVIIGFAVSPTLWLFAGGLLVASQSGRNTAPANATEQLETSPSAATPLSNIATGASPKLTPQAPNTEIASSPSGSAAPLALPPIERAANQPEEATGSENVTSSPQFAAAEPTDSENPTKPSFDCSKASTIIEKTICSDPALSHWDSRMGLAFKRDFDQIGGGQHRLLLRAQRRWLALRKSQCDVPDQIYSKGCILRLTMARVATLESSAAAQSTLPASIVPPDVATAAVPELLPAAAENFMVGNSDNACPPWNGATEAEEIIVYLTGAIESYADSIKDIKTNAAQVIDNPAGDPAAAAVNQLINEDQTHLSAMTLCRDAIAEKLGLSELVVQRLYDYNTLTKDEAGMFHDLEIQNYDRSPDFSTLAARPDKSKTLHIIDIELRDLDYDASQFRTMLEKDAGTEREETDRKILANETDFREKLSSLRASIASNSNAGGAP